MYQVTRRFRFEAAHRLPDYDGKCKWLHGHSYVAEVTVESRDLDGQGMVVDFAEMKNAVGDWIDRHWDHGLLLKNTDAIETDAKVYILYFGQPTAENMASIVFDVVSNWLAKQVDQRQREIRPVKVRIQETADCWAEYHRGGTWGKALSNESEHIG